VKPSPRSSHEKVNDPSPLSVASTCWSGDGVTLVFVSKASIAGNSGFYLLSVPAERIVAGVPLEVRVEGVGGDPAGWFMVKDLRDTLTTERVTPALAVEATQGAWRDRPLAFVAP